MEIPKSPPIDSVEVKSFLYSLSIALDKACDESQRLLRLLESNGSVDKTEVLAVGKFFHKNGLKSTDLIELLHYLYAGEIPLNKDQCPSCKSEPKNAPAELSSFKGEAEPGHIVPGPWPGSINPYEN